MDAKDRMKERFDAIHARYLANLEDLRVLLRRRQEPSASLELVRGLAEALVRSCKEVSRDFLRWKADAIDLELRGLAARDSFAGLVIPDALPEEL